MKFPNPLIPGFNPDPSVVAVGGAYYLVTSTFEYLPGLPVYRSTDLTDWTHIGNVASRPEQAAVTGVPTGGGVWAPTIRYRDGVFYVIVTIAMSPRGCVVFTAADPAGPWSDGTTIDGVGFYGLGAGVPVTPWDWSFDLDDETATTMLSACPQGVVLVLHSPPQGHCDSNGSGDHFGSPALLAAIEAKRPRLAVCGHIHESWGCESAIGETVVRNLGPTGTWIEI